MNNYFVILAVFVVELLISSCSTDPSRLQKSGDQCRQADVCKVRGVLTMSNDGHAYIGKLQLSDGSCINVSLPESQSRSLFDRPAVVKTIKGRVFAYIHEDTFIDYRINNRPIGYGSCGSFFVFVK